MNRSCKYGVALCASVALSNVFAAEEPFDATVDRFLITGADKPFGGCMVRFNWQGGNPNGYSSPANSTLDCPDDWVTLDCDGLYDTKSVARDKLSAVQFAYVADLFVRVRLSDVQKHSFYCMATQVQVSKSTGG